MYALFYFTKHLIYYLSSICQLSFSIFIKVSHYNLFFTISINFLFSSIILSILPSIFNIILIMPISFLTVRGYLNIFVTILHSLSRVLHFAVLIFLSYPTKRQSNFLTILCDSNGLILVFSIFRR